MYIPCINIIFPTSWDKYYDGSIIPSSKIASNSCKNVLALINGDGIKFLRTGTWWKIFIISDNLLKFPLNILTMFILFLLWYELFINVFIKNWKKNALKSIVKEY